MELKRGQALVIRPAAGPLSLQPSYQTAGIAVAPPEMRIDWKEDRRADHFPAGGEPKLMIALAIGGDGVQTIAGQFAENRERLRIRERTRCKAVGSSRDSEHCGEA